MSTCGLALVLEDCSVLLEIAKLAQLTWQLAKQVESNDNEGEHKNWKKKEIKLLFMTFLINMSVYLFIYMFVHLFVHHYVVS